MKEKVSDLVYSARTLCEALRERFDSLDEEVKDFLEETESCLEKFAIEEEEDLFD